MQDAQVNNKKLYIGNLSYTLTQEGVQELCEEFGEVVDVKLITDFNSGRSKGFAFVEFKDQEAADAALEGLAEREVDGRNLFVKVARPKQPREDRSYSDRRGGGGGGRSGGGRSGGYGNNNRGGYGDRS